MEHFHSKNETKKVTILVLDQDLSGPSKAETEECNFQLKIFSIPCHPLVFNMLLSQPHQVLLHIGVVFQIFVEGSHNVQSPVILRLD